MGRAPTHDLRTLLGVGSKDMSAVRNNWHAKGINQSVSARPSSDAMTIWYVAISSY